MKKRQNNSARASALQITLAVALMSVSAILLASSFNAAQSNVAPEAQAPDPQPLFTCGGGNIRVEATNAGNNADYLNLANAFAAINAGTHTGVIDIGVCADTAEPVGGAVLLASGGASSYTSVLVRPSGARIITGAATAGLPLIDLNGADAVTIDGLNTGGNSLTISNTTVSATAGTSTIRLINGASSNVITGCSVLGSSSSIVATAGGNILISTSTGGTNSGNTISGNAIGPAGANLPTKGIMSLGSVSPNHNTGNIIDNNNIFDFFQGAVASAAGISLQANTALTTVNNNRIYQTAPRVATITVTYSGIIMATSGFNNTITNNTVGFGAANGTGTTTISGSTNIFIGLNLSSGSTVTATSVQNNRISGINQTTASTGTGSGSAFRGIFLAGGRYDVGTTTGNTIGSLDGSSTIAFTETATGAFAGIYDFTSSSNFISNNNIGAITINGAATSTGGFRGVVFNTAAAALNTLNNNSIGASGAGAITHTGVAAYAMYAVQNSLGVLSATGNTIRNMSGNSNAAALIVSSGILSTSTSTTAGPNLVSQNVIHSLSNASGAASNSIYALYTSFPATTANVVERNIVHSLSITSTATTSQLVGILPVAGQGTYKNNMVRLGVDAAGASISTGYQIYGMFEVAGVNNLYFNSVYIGGTAVTDASTTFGFVSNVTTSATRNYVNNIFDNARSNGVGTGKHYAIALSGLGGVTSNRNDLYAPGTGGFVGLFAGDQLTLANWQAATGQDANSISADPLFLDPNGTARPGLGDANSLDAVTALVNLHIAGGSPCVNAGVTIPSVTIDIDGQLRAPTPDVGADQVTAWTGANIVITKTADAAQVSYPNQIGFVVKLNNIYAVGATGLSVTDALPNPGGSLNWSIDGGATDAGWSISGAPPTQSLVYAPTTLAANTMTQAHVITTTSLAKCGLTIANTASFTSSNGGSGNASASVLIIGQAFLLFSEAFDSVVAPALPAGWVASNAVGAAPLWVTTITTPDTAPNAAFVDDPATISDKRLDSPSIGIQTANAEVTFRNNYALENGFDGGVLEVSVNAGAFTDILAAGGSFVTGGYNGTISLTTSFGSPIIGRAAWTGTSVGPYLTTTAKLPPSAAGGTVVLRWRMGSDNSVSGAGWRIDGVSVTDFPCVAGPTPTPAPTGTPTPTPTPSPTPTPTPAPTGTPCPSPVPVLSQDFESGLGSWTAVNTSSGGTFPALVIWAAQTNPYPLTGVGGGASTEVLNSGSGTQFAIGNSDAGGSGVTAFTTLTSPSFSTVGFSSLSISYKHYYRHITSAAAFLEVSTDGGTIWNLAKSYGATTGAAAAFVPDTVDLSAYIGNANVKVRFRHSGGWFWYWAVDDIIVSTCGGATPTPPPTLSVTGTVIYCTNPALPAISGVTMSLTGAPPAPTSVLTDGSGIYTLTGLVSGSSYTVTPTKTAKPPGTSGINTSDSIAIQRHFLVLGTPLTGCRLLAADTNVPPNGVTTTDAIAAQRFFLGLTTGIAQTGRYVFSPANISYAPINANQTSQNYNAIILGDAATAFVAPRPGGPEPDAAIENEIASSVAYVSIDRAGVSSSAIDAKSNLVGFQGDFTFDERVVTFADIPVSNAGLTAGNWNVSANVLDGPGPIRTLRVSAFSLDGAPLSGTGVLFNLNTTNVDRAADGTLTWASGGEPFVFIDANLNTQRPGHGAPSQR